MQNQWQDAYPGIVGRLLSYANFAASRNVEQGAYSALYAATSPEIEEKGWNGYYFNDPVRLQALDCSRKLLVAVPISYANTLCRPLPVRKLSKPVTST